jgi:chromosome segregation protein
MHLRSLTLKGFKSFPDRTRLEFSTGVSVVVGPNGSGKSNVTDAVLWAMGEQSPLAVRGQSMQDVIFAGGHGVQARDEAEVEVVLDNADGALDLPVSEIAIARRLDRAGEGEYRINGARCRLVDVLELLSDTGLGKEMHSVVSQGRIEQIVTSKPRDRRLLIEEAAGLGKHRKRRRRAQLKLDRTQDNLDRALDVEREARTRLRPLKRQAEAAELHARLERQTDEAHWALRREDLRASLAALASAEAAATAARAAHAAVERELAGLRARREAAEGALAARSTEREALGNRVYAARSAAERIGLRLETARVAVLTLEDRRARRRALVAGLEAEPGDDDGDTGAAERVAALEAELEQLAQDRHERLARELVELQERLAAAALETARLAEAARVSGSARAAAEAAAEAARLARREAETAAEAARREAARVGAELAAVNQFLRSHAGAPGGAPALADALRADAGYELALAAALGPRLRAAVASDLGEAGALLDRAGADGGAALVAGFGVDREAASIPGEGDVGSEAARGSRGPGAGAEPLLAHVHPEGSGAAARLARRMLADVWVVDELSGLAPDFDGIAVTRSGRVWSSRTCELRQLPGGGEDRVLAERNRRVELVAASDAAARAEHLALAEVERVSAAVAAAEAARDEADRADRAAGRARDEAAESERHAGWLIEQRRSGPDEGPAATRRAQLGAALAAERRLAERAERERQARELRLALEHEGLARDAELQPLAARFVAALEAAGAAVAERLGALQAELDADREAGERLAGELRDCAAAESAAHGRLSESAEAVTGGEVRAQQTRDRAEEAGTALGALATKLGLPAEPATEAIDDEERAALAARVERLLARREQLGPVNPLAQDEYAEAVAHVEELEAQREDLETALRELEGLIRDTDRRIREAFEETFTAAAANFQEVVEHLFPGGRGRLRLVREDAGPRPVLGGAEVEASAETDAATDEERIERAAEAEAAERGGGDPDDGIGVEIEITPAGKATRRLSLLSGGEKSLTALAFLFAVFLAKPCPFYILDEVEAALDDLNIDRFLSLLKRFSSRAQFIVVTHQKRTMEAADCLYGVSMAGNGVSKVVSRRLPERAGVAASARDAEAAATAAERDSDTDERDAA